MKIVVSQNNGGDDYVMDYSSGFNGFMGSRISEQLHNGWVYSHSTCCSCHNGFSEFASRQKIGEMIQRFERKQVEFRGLCSRRVAYGGSISYMEEMDNPRVVAIGASAGGLDA